MGAFLDKSGIDVERVRMINKMVESGNMEGARRQITDSDVQNFSIAGDPQECLAGFRQLGGIGVKSVCPMLFGGPDPEEAIRLFAREGANIPS